MTDIDQSTVRNRLLRVMSPTDFALLLPHLAFCAADKGAVLVEKDAIVENVWFLECGIGSIITISTEGHQIESGLFGRDGFAPTSTVMGSDRSPNKIIIHVPDHCYRIGVDALNHALAQSASLRDLLLRFVQALSIQTSYTALANAVHPIEERLARWLLMCHDRVDDSEFALTHEFLSIMLAVRRPSVTTSLHVLEGNGFIRAERGCVVIRNRAALEEFAGDAYGTAEREYERLIGNL